MCKCGGHIWSVISCTTQTGGLTINISHVLRAHLQLCLHLIIQLLQQCLTLTGRHGSRPDQSFAPLLP